MVHWAVTGGPGRLGILPHPRGAERLDEEMRCLRADGAEVLVSLLEQREVRELGLEAEAGAAAAAGIAFLSHPIRDHGLPLDADAFRGLALDLAGRLGQGSHVAIHCWAGMGRSSLVAASVLAARGIPVSRAFELLSACRGFTVPDTLAQVAWVERFAEELNPGE